MDGYHVEDGGYQMEVTMRDGGGSVPVGTEDVVSSVRADHDKVEHLLSSLDSTADSGLAEYFCQLREELVRHEVAEELIVYPAFRRNVPGGDAIADRRISEQSEAEAALARLEKHENEPVVLRAGLLQLRRDVLEHAENEEREVLPALETHTKAKDLQDLGQRYRKALDSAPTHPHPHMPDTPPGNVLLGPIAAVVDRMRDAMRPSS
jgi:hemerythrin superfamily protein